MKAKHPDVPEFLRKEFDPTDIDEASRKRRQQANERWLEEISRRPKGDPTRRQAE